MTPAANLREMRVTQEEFDRYLAQVRTALNDPSVAVSGELWDDGRKVRMTAAWGWGEWPFATEWRADAMPRPADVAVRIAARVRDSAIPADLTEAERRAFIFGPWIRRMAQERFCGSLETACRQLSSEERVAQHRRDLDMIRPQHREHYLALVRAAGGSGFE